MLPRSRPCGLLVTAALSAIVNTTPSSLSPRADGYTQVYHGDGGSYTFFNYHGPTCAKDHRLTDCITSNNGNTTTPTVIVRPDCDSVIDTLCKAMDRQLTRSSGRYPAQIDPSLNMTGMYHVNGTCEGHIMFPYADYASDLLNYTSCVRTFQLITTTCMLVDDPLVDGENEASWGYQAGVVNMAYFPRGSHAASYYSTVSPTSPKWVAPTTWSTYPGYMMGPVGYWGTSAPGVDSDDVRKDGTVAY